MYNYENMYDYEKTTKEINKELWVVENPNKNYYNKEWGYVLTKKWENALVTLTLEVAKEKFHERKYFESIKYLMMHIKYKIEFTYKNLTYRKNVSKD